ncbi:hypothetical protein [Clostridium sp.]|uniref:DUF7678 domain-containing protein n=1 Tax=Clostridium sp. TaxID=1506 RepID=UPI00260DEC92|nr:hypothetical protein [Clostridium sp.]
MKAKFTKFDSTTNWVSGVVEDYKFEAKLFDEGSVFGIDEGRVSKLSILDNKNVWLVNYDRGWDIEPKEDFKEIYNTVMELLENSPKRFEY